MPQFSFSVQDSQVTLQRMLSSPFLAGHRDEVEDWVDRMRDTSEIVQEWISAQTNVSLVGQ